MRSLSLALLLLASPLIAQPVSIGSTSGIDMSFGLAGTTIDMTHPATAQGQVTTAFVRWLGSGCNGALKLKVVRLDPIAGVFNVVADRGPFLVTGGGNRLTITPPIDVLAGDLLATVVQPGCGNVAAAHARYGDFILTTNADFSSGKSISGFNISRDAIPLVQVTSDTSLLAGVIPAAGAVAGNFGSFFRTSMQLANPTTSISQGRIVFHPSGVAGANDPFRTFSLQPFTTATHPDIVTEMGLSGLGSIDVVMTSGPPPVVNARVFNDQGDAGTSGFYEDLVAPADMLHAGDSASFTIPGDPANFRVNAGIRTLTATTYSVTYHDSAGTPIGGTNFKSYAANTFDQVSLSAFLNGQPISAGGVIVVKIVSGDAVLYFSITDNRTNDTSATMLRP